MAWSTRRLAELAGTTVKTVRHYHAIGLLTEPERADNGYKEYGTAHLVRLLQIRRLRDLGMGLAEIAATHDPETFRASIQALDDQLRESIEHQQAVRTDLAELLGHGTGPDVPAGFEDLAPRLSEADRSIIPIIALYLDGRGMRDLRDITADHGGADIGFEDLAADAEEQTVQAVALRLSRILRIIRDQYPGHQSHPPRARVREMMQVFERSLTELYNPAQVRVLREADRLARSDSFPG